MRKDAKIGFAIGGVLLAVLTVYVLVVPSHKKSPAPGSVTLAVPPGGSTADSSVTIPPANTTDTAKADTADKPEDAKPAVARNDGVNWERILGGQSDAPTVKTTTPTQADAPATDTQTVATNTTPAPTNTADIPMVAVTPPAPLPVATPATQPAGGRLYTIKPGQTLSLIAAEIYGNPRFYVAIKRANPTLDANHLKPGMRITLPDISDVKPGGHEAIAETAGAGSTGKTYKVQSGDTLYRISKNLYGSPKQADAIYELNKESIGADKARLRLGMVLRLPAAPMASATASR
jgi:nucleoid-associated protein YgaU